MAIQVTSSPIPDRPTSLEHLVIQAELGQDEIVRTGVASLHPADTAELLNVLEEPEVKTQSLCFSGVTPCGSSPQPGFPPHQKHAG